MKSHFCPTSQSSGQHTYDKSWVIIRLRKEVKVVAYLHKGTEREEEEVTKKRGLILFIKDKDKAIDEKKKKIDRIGERIQRNLINIEWTILTVVKCRMKFART